MAPISHIAFLAISYFFIQHGSALPTVEHIVRRDAYNAPRLVAYVQTFHDTSGQPLSLLPLLNEDTKITHVNLASLHVNQDAGDIRLNDNNPDDSYWDQVWSDVKQLQDSGVKVLMMVGGAAQGSYRRLCGGSGPATIDESYYGPLRDIIKAHNIDGLDLDIEETVDVSCALKLLQRLDSDFGHDFILTMAPVASALIPGGPGLSGFDYFDLDSQATSSGRRNGKLVDWYNGQFYNGWGDASSATYYNNIIESGGWDPERIVMGVLDASNDGGSGFVPIATLQSTIKQLRTNYAHFGCAVGWEYWDAGRDDGFDYPWQWVKTVGESIFGTQNAAQKNLTTEPLPHSPAPFEGLTKLLSGLGVEWEWAVWALNVTEGNLLEAKKLLDLGL